MIRLTKAMSAFTFGRSAPAAGRDAFAFVTRGASSGVNGSGAPSRTRVVAALSALALSAFALFAFNTASADAAPRVESATFGSLGSEGGQLTQARGLAVLEAGAPNVPPGTVYVVELGNNRISSFAPDDGGTPGEPSDDTYSFLRAWGWDVIVNTDPVPANDNGTGFEICDTTTLPPNTPEECKAGVSGSVAGQLNRGGQFNGINGGIAVDQSTGVVLVYDAGNRRVQQFSADGEFLRAWGKNVASTGGEGFEICEDASVCQAGATTATTEAGAFGANTTAVGGPAVDAAGNVYVSDPANARLQKFSPTGSFLAMGGWDVVTSGVNNSAEIQKVTVDAASGNFTLSFGAAAPTTTVAIDHDASAGEVQEALEDLGGVAVGDVRVAGPDGGPWTVRFRANLGNFNHPLLGFDATNLSGDNPALPGAGPTLAVTELIAGATALAYEVCEAGTTDICKGGSSGAGFARFSGGATQGATPSFIASSRAGDIYIIGKTNQTMYHLYSSLDFVEEYAATTGAGTATNRSPIAVDPVSGHLLFGQNAPAAPKVNPSIFELDPFSGGLVETHPTPVGSEWTGLTIDGTTQRMFGTRTGAAGVVNVFEEGLPSVVVQPPDPKTGTKATLKGTVNPNGVEVVECYFLWGPTTAYGNVAPCDPEATSIGNGTTQTSVTAVITGLVPNGATYNYRLVAVGAKEARSANQSFTTPSTVVTQAATPLAGGAAATLNGSVNPDGVAITDCLFEWGASTAYGNEVACDQAPGSLTGTTALPITADVSGLHPGTVYNFRTKVTYADGIGPINGANLTFQTLGPRIVATWSEDVAFTEARLKAQIDPEGVATTYRFEYGSQGPCSTNPCASVPSPDGAVGSDSNVHKLSRFLEGLQPGTTYHYRVVATDANDVINEGPDLSFHTFNPLDLNTNCANQAFRTGPSAHLPDCRAYEMVSPIDKNGGDIETTEEEIGIGSRYSSSYRQASVEGGKITFSSGTAFGDAIGGHWSNQYLAARDDASGWSTQPISSRRGQTVLEPELGYQANFRWRTYGFFQGFTPDLSSAWIRDNNLDPLASSALQGSVNLYRRDNELSSYSPLTIGQPFNPPSPALTVLGKDATSATGGPRVLGASDDLRHQVFVANAALTPSAVVSNNAQIYDLVDGELHLVSVLTDGTPATTNTFVGAASVPPFTRTREQMLKNAVSANGSRIVWTSSFGNNGPGAIYVRENPGAVQTASGACDEVGKACTIHVAGQAVQDDGPLGQRAQFWAASNSGSHVLYSLGDKPSRALHLFDVDAKTSTPIAGQSVGVAATSEDLSHIYFISREVKAPGGVAGESNLYLYEQGAYTHLGLLTSHDVQGPSSTINNSQSFGPSIVGDAGGLSDPRAGLNQTRVSPDGRTFVFMSNSAALSQSVAGYDNTETDTATGHPTFQVYRYDAESEELSCVSCKPSGARPSHSHFVRVMYSPYGYEHTGYPDRRVAASIPTPEHDNYASRVLSDDGERVFFHSDDALLPTDTNGVQDVYQWQAEGTGECEVGDENHFPQNDGCISLISTGRDGAKSEFVDATPNGDEVYISVDESLDSRDPGSRDIYVAKVGGGFAVESPIAPCEGEACQTPPAPPEFGSPSSKTFEGPGNEATLPPARCNRNQVRRGNGCVAKRRLAKKACAKRKGKAKQRCVNKQMRRLNSIGRAGR